MLTQMTRAAWRPLKLHPHCNLPVAMRWFSTLQPRAAMSCRYALLSVLFLKLCSLLALLSAACRNVYAKNTCNAFVNTTIPTSRYFAWFHFLVIRALLRTSPITFLYFLHSLTDGATCLSPQQMALVSLLSPPSSTNVI
jgi:hypothetical protein